MAAIDPAALAAVVKNIVMIADAGMAAGKTGGRDAGRTAAGGGRNAARITAGEIRRRDVGRKSAVRGRGDVIPAARRKGVTVTIAVVHREEMMAVKGLV